MKQQPDWLMIKTIKLFIAQSFIKTMPHQIFLAVIFVLRLIVIFNFLIFTSHDQSIITIQQSLILFVLWLCLVYTIITILSICYMLFRLYKRVRSSKRNQQQSYLYKIIEKLVVYSLVVYRIFLVIPMLFVVCAALRKEEYVGEQEENRGMITGLVVTNLLLGLGIIYPLSGIGFWNKIGIRHEGLAYCTVLNIQSLSYIFIPIIIILRVYAWQVQPYLGIVFTTLSLLTLYIYPIVSFNHNKLHTISTSAMISIICVLNFSVLIQGWVDTFGKYLVVLLCVGMMTLAMWQLQQYRMRGLLVVGGFGNKQNINNNNRQADTQQQSNNISWLDNQCYYENLLYHLINWHQSQQQLLLYVISTLKYNQTIMIQSTQNVGEKNIFYQQQQQQNNLNKNNQLIAAIVKNDSGLMNGKNQSTLSSSHKNQIQHINKNKSSNPIFQSTTTHIMSTLSQQQVNQQHLYHLFCMLIQQKLNQKCNLQQIDNQKLGHRQLLKVLEQNIGYFILLVQSMMLQSKNFTKTYLLIKLLQQLLQKAQTSSFIQSTYSLAIVSIIQTYFLLQFKTHTNQYSPVYNYFQFQQKYEKLKNYIKLSAQNKLLFWKQTNKQQPLEKKMKQYITKNYLFQMKILKHTHKITNTYTTSPLLLLSLIQSYTELALNTNMSSSKNIFNFLAIQFHKLYNDNKNKFYHKNNQLKQNQSKLTYNNNMTTLKDNKKNDNVLQNVYTMVENNPSQMEKSPSLAQPIEKYQQNTSKYAIEKNIGVFLINMQSHQYNIEWANQYFWQHYTQKNKPTQNSQKDIQVQQSKKQFKLNDFIVPQLRQIHTKYIHDFIHEGTSLAYRHSQTQLYFQNDQTFIDVQMQFQFLPTLAQGLKMMGFVHPVKGNKKDVVQFIIRSDLTFVACTKSFMDHYDQYSLLKDHLNFQKDKALAFDIIMQNNIFSEFFNNLRLRQSGYAKKQQTTYQQQNQRKQKQQSDTQSRITHLGMEYTVKLKKKIQYQGKSRDGMKQNQMDIKKHLFVFQLETQQSMQMSKSQAIVVQDDKQQVMTPLKKSKSHKRSLQAMTESLFLQQDKIDHSPRSPKFMDSPKSSQSSLFKGSQSSSFKGSQSSLFKGSQSSFYKGSTLKSGRTSPKDNEKDDIIMEDILIKERQKIQDKPMEIINLQKCYEILVSQKTPKNVKKWRFFTVIILILLMAAMVCNMGFLTQRQQLYNDSNQLAINYSSLIADLSATVTAIRQYNFYAATYSTDRPQIPFLIKKLVDLSDLISKKVKLLASVLKEVWLAYEILPTGATVDVHDTSYVVISNYLLSSVTFTSQLPSSNMTFPILVDKMYADKLTPTPAQISFLEAVFNGLYVAIPNLLVDRRQFINAMTDNLLSNSSMYFIYTCIGGSLCLVLFFISSLILELRSQGIRSQTGGLLSSELITLQQKSRKIERLQKLGQILQKSKGQTLMICDWEDQQSKYKYLDILARTLKDMDHPDQNNNNSPHLQEGQSDVELNDIVSKQHIIDDKTNREFMDNEESVRSSQVSSVDGQHMSQEHTQKGMKNGDFEVIERLKSIKPRKNIYIEKNEVGGAFQLYKVTIKQRSLLIIFYLIVCIPFLCYFIGILIGSMSINSTIVKHITITSQVQNRKSYQEIVYLLTRQTAYYENYLVQKVPDWNKYLMAMIDQTYDRDRKTQKLVMDQNTAVNLQKKLAQLNHNNLCQQLSQFQTSTYYNINFLPQQCNTLGNNIITQGYKQLVVSLLQSSLEMNKNYPNPVNLTDNQRVQYLSRYQLRKMKALLAYSEQFVQQMVSASQTDTQVQIEKLREISILLSIISIFSLILLLLVIRYRYKKLLLQRRQVQSIISLISIQTISNSLNLNQKQKSQNNQLIKMVQKINWKFYQ